MEMMKGKYSDFILEAYSDDSHHCVHHSNTVNIHYLFNGYAMIDIHVYHIMIDIKCHDMKFPIISAIVHIHVHVHVYLYTVPLHMCIYFQQLLLQHNVIR